MAVFREKFSVAALLNYSAAVKYDDLMRIFDSGQAVSNDDDCALLPETLQSLLDAVFGYCIQCASGLINISKCYLRKA